MFEIDQHVVCIKGSDCHYCTNTVKNKIYTVRGIYKGYNLIHGDGILGLYFDEIKNKPIFSSRLNKMVEIGYNSLYFKPLKKLKVEDFLKVELKEEVQY